MAPFFGRGSILDAPVPSRHCPGGANYSYYSTTTSNSSGSWSSSSSSSSETPSRSQDNKTQRHHGKNLEGNKDVSTENHHANSNENQHDKDKESSNDNLSNENENKDDDMHLHIGPTGDCWIAPSLFANKHLPPGYVKSISLAPLLRNETCPSSSSSSSYSSSLLSSFQLELLLQELETNQEMARMTYDQGKVSMELWNQITYKAKFMAQDAAATAQDTENRDTQNSSTTTTSLPGRRRRPPPPSRT
ncbi:hypothetical protein ACA910_011613 [Epithemia clementina (nom. ined.)]